MFVTDGLRSYPAAFRELKVEGELRSTCRQQTRRYANTPVESDHRHVKRRLRVMQWPRTAATAAAVIQGIEAANIIRKGQVLGITRRNLHGQAWVYGSLLGAANKTKYWDLYVEFYQTLNQRNEQGLPVLFAEELARTYAERAAQKKR